MMTDVFAVIVVCVLLIVAYLFDISSKYTRIPSVIMLLALGWIVRRITNTTGVQMPDLYTILPSLGSFGLILIVLEGALELEINSGKVHVLRKSFIMALLPLLLNTGFLAFLFMRVTDYGLSDAVLNAIPLAVISSAIAIPSAGNLNPQNREFIIYESSFSDIIGVLFFNFMMMHTELGLSAIADFGFKLLLMLLVSLSASLALAYLLRRIQHHVKFMPIIILILLIYEISKVFHLPGLLFILIFGLILGNLTQLKRFHLVKRLKPDLLIREVHKFKDIAGEVAFVVRALFFILFGFLISTEDVLNQDSLLLSVLVFLAIVFVRFVYLLLLRKPLLPLLFIAPRGLISILLFLSLPASRYIPLMNNALVIQVVLLTALFMMLGLMFSKVKSEPQS